MRGRILFDGETCRIEVEFENKEEMQKILEMIRALLEPHPLK
jgi:hypothetical protein